MNYKVVLVTGARRGLGLVVAEEFAKNGYAVILNDMLDTERLEEYADKFSKTYNVLTMACLADVSKEEEVQQMLEAVYKKFDHIDVLVNNAANVIDMELKDRPTSLFNETLINNVTGTYLMCKFVGSKMMERKTGKIINVSSTNGINAFFPTSIDYDASKAAVINMTHNFALEYAPYVCVNTVAPGWMNTEMNTQLPLDLVEEETERIYLKRFADPIEIAHMILFLGSDKANYVNSSVIKVDGGY